MDDNGWNEHKKLIMFELAQLQKAVGDISTKLDGIKTDIVILKVKAGVFGLLAGAIPVAIALLMKKL